MSRCRDDLWMWAAFAVAASAADQPSCPCSCRHHDEEWEPSEEELAERAERYRIEAAKRRREWLTVLPWSIVFIAAIVWKIFSPPSPSIGRTELPANATPVAAETPAEAPLHVTPPAVADAEPIAESITMPAPLSTEPPPALASESIIDDSAVLSAVAPTLTPAALDLAFFDVGSSREEVIAAEGRPPTYRAHHDRTLWWGSSRVEFDDAGRVRSWVSGTPPLNVDAR